MTAILPFNKFREEAAFFENLATLDQLVIAAAGPAYDDQAWTVKEFSYPLPEKGNLSFAAIQNRLPIGFSIGYAFSENWLHISRVAIHPEQTGQGIAKKMLNLQLIVMRELNPEVISVDTRQQNRAALRLYEDLGFTVLTGEELAAYIKIRNREPVEYLGAKATHFALALKTDPNFKFNAT